MASSAPSRLPGKMLRRMAVPVRSAPSSTIRRWWSGSKTRASERSTIWTTCRKAGSSSARMASVPIPMTKRRAAGSNSSTRHVPMSRKHSFQRTNSRSRGTTSSSSARSATRKSRALANGRAATLTSSRPRRKPKSLEVSHGSASSRRRRSLAKGSSPSSACSSKNPVMCGSSARSARRADPPHDLHGDRPAAESRAGARQERRCHARHRRQEQREHDAPRTALCENLPDPSYRNSRRARGRVVRKH